MSANPVLSEIAPVDELQSPERLAAVDAGGLQALADLHETPADVEPAPLAMPGADDAFPSLHLAQEAALDPALWPPVDPAETLLVALDEGPLLDPLLDPAGDPQLDPRFDPALLLPDGANPFAVELAYDSIPVEWRHLGADAQLHAAATHHSEAFGALSGTVLDAADLLDSGAHPFGSAGFTPGHHFAGAAPAYSGAGITPLDTDFDARGGVPGGPGGGGSGGGDPGVLTNYFAGADDGTAGYDIWIEFKGTWTVDLQAAFKNAADYFVTVITADIGGGGLYHGKTIDDLYITAELKAIDGTGGILGQAGPTAVWSATDLTAAGTMQFDSADATTFYGLGLWDDIVTHEMMHVLGFGSLWTYQSHDLVTNYQYTGENALAAYNSYFGTTADFIPVESDGGSGTAGAHWDEQSLGNELMTGYINNSNYLSQFSVMSLADLGYNVTYQDYPYDSTVIA
ncbi:MAG: leishmanolysin-related zinc metalloendopeptidase [Dongiaceae bacterium]